MEVMVYVSVEGRCREEGVQLYLRRCDRNVEPR